MTAQPVIYHRAAKLYGIDPKLLSHRNKLFVALDELTKELDLHIVKKFSHQFKPHGLSVLLVLAESHLAIHTWPEYGFLHFDIVSCGDEDDLSNLPKALKDAFHPKSLTCRKVS